MVEMKHKHGSQDSADISGRVYSEGGKDSPTEGFLEAFKGVTAEGREAKADPRVEGERRPNAWFHLQLL